MFESIHRTVLHRLRAALRRPVRRAERHAHGHPHALAVRVASGRPSALQPDHSRFRKRPAEAILAGIREAVDARPRGSRPIDPPTRPRGPPRCEHEPLPRGVRPQPRRARPGGLPGGGRPPADRALRRARRRPPIGVDQLVRNPRDEHDQPEHADQQRQQGVCRLSLGASRRPASTTEAPIRRRFVAAFAQTNAGDMSPNLAWSPGTGPHR